MERQRTNIQEGATQHLLCWKKAVWLGLSEQVSDQLAGGRAENPVPQDPGQLPQREKRNVDFVEAKSHAHLFQPSFKLAM